MLSFKRKFCVFVLSIYATPNLKFIKLDDYGKKHLVRLIELFLKNIF